MKLRHGSIFLAYFLVVLAISMGVSTRADSYTFTAVEVPGSTVTVVTGINDRGEVVGWYRTGVSGMSDVVGHGFLLANGQFTTIDAPGSTGSDGGVWDQ